MKQRLDHFQKYRDVDGKWRWRFVRSNGKVIGVASEGYNRQIDCDKSIMFLAASGDAPIVTLDHPPAAIPPRALKRNRE